MIFGFAVQDFDRVLWGWRWFVALRVWVLGLRKGRRISTFQCSETWGTQDWSLISPACLAAGSSGAAAAATAAVAAAAAAKAAVVLAVVLILVVVVGRRVVMLLVVVMVVIGVQAAITSYIGISVVAVVLCNCGFAVGTLADFMSPTPRPGAGSGCSTGFGFQGSELTRPSSRHLWRACTDVSPCCGSIAGVLVFGDSCAG